MMEATTGFLTPGAWNKRCNDSTHTHKNHENIIDLMISEIILCE